MVFTRTHTLVIKCVNITREPGVYSVIQCVVLYSTRVEDKPTQVPVQRIRDAEGLKMQKSMKTKTNILRQNTQKNCVCIFRGFLCTHVSGDPRMFGGKHSLRSVDMRETSRETEPNVTPWDTNSILMRSIWLKRDKHGESTSKTDPKAIWSPQVSL